jgi:hypothetical protein
MTAHEYIRILRSMDVDSRAAFMLATTHGATPTFWLEVLESLLGDLRSLRSPGSTEYEAIAAILNAHVTQVPVDAFRVAENLRGAVVGVLDTIVLLPNGYRDRFRAVQKLLELQPDIRLVGKQVCKALDSGIVLDRPGPELTILGNAFQTVTFANVDSVLAFIAEMRQTYVTTDASPVGVLLAWLESELRLVGLRDVLGHTLRVQYVREVVAAGILDKAINILIVGQTGTSKTFMAEKMAMNSRYRHLVRVNCASGIRKTKAQIGDGLQDACREPTTLLLDEVYSLPERVQEFCLVEFCDSSRDMRVISTSSTPLAALRNRLKPDFMARIQGWMFSLRELSATPDDLEEIVLEYARAQQIDLDRPVVECLMRNYHWPENHRELASFIKQLAIFARTRNCAAVDIAFLRDHKDSLHAEMIEILVSLF